jgi:transcription elongation GreA/GreB family factor
MNKSELLNQIIAGLHENLEALQKAARASHAEATHESSKPENKYDTRGLEAAYLAGGQARQAREILDSIKIYSAMEVKAFGPSDPIDLGALVELEADRGRSFYFIGPRSGGLEFALDGREVTVITPQSPLGQSLMGKSAAQRWTTGAGRSIVTFRIVSVS